MVVQGVELHGLLLLFLHILEENLFLYYTYLI